MKNSTRIEVKKNKSGDIVASADIFGRRISYRLTDEKAVAAFISSVNAHLDEFGATLHEDSIQQMKGDLTSAVNNLPETPSVIDPTSVKVVVFWDKAGMGIDIIASGQAIMGITHILHMGDLNAAIDKISEELVDIGCGEIPEDAKVKITGLVIQGFYDRQVALETPAGQVFAAKTSCGSFNLYTAPLGQSKLDAYKLDRAADELAELVGDEKCECPLCHRNHALAEMSSYSHEGKKVTAHKLDFGTALSALKAGQSIACYHWPKDVFLLLAGMDVGESYIVMKTSNDKLMPWAPTHESLLSDSWVILA